MCRLAIQPSTELAAMPFGHLTLTHAKPKNNNYLWKSSHYPSNPQHIGEQIKKRRFDLKMTAVECRKILAVDKSTLFNWEQGKHKPRLEMLKRIARFLCSTRHRPSVLARLNGLVAAIMIVVASGGFDSDPASTTPSEHALGSAPAPPAHP